MSRTTYDVPTFGLTIHDVTGFLCREGIYLTDDQAWRLSQSSLKSDPQHIELMANQLYTTYCAAVGGTAFNGDPLPSWEEFAGDGNKTKQADAWRAAARKSLGSD